MTRAAAAAARLLPVGCRGAGSAAGAGPGRDGRSRLPRILLEGSPVLEALPSPSYSASLWRVEDGALAWDERASADTIAVRQAGERAAGVHYAGDVRVLEGDVAGLVLRSNADGSECLAVLLGAQSRTVRLVSLPWPGRDLLARPFPVEPNRTYHLAVTARQTGEGLRLSVTVDGAPAAEHTAPPLPAGTHLGVLALPFICL